MASKFGVCCCLTCGEYLRSTMNDTIEQFEMHMCSIEPPQEKKQKLLDLRKVIDGEIAKITETMRSDPASMPQMMLSTCKQLPPPPPMPQALPTLTSLPQAMPKG